MASLRTPLLVERWLRRLPYNHEKGGETLRTFRRVVRDHTAHCLEAALFAAAVLEAHGYPPLLMSLESSDQLDHVIFVYRKDGRWGSDRPLARSRPARPLAGLRVAAGPGPELHGPVRGQDGPPRGLGGGRPARARAATTGASRPRNAWKVERWLIDYPHHKVHMPDRRYHEWHERYLRYIARYRRQEARLLRESPDLGG